MFISCRHTQQSQSIIQFINKLPGRTALNNTTQIYVTNYIETKYDTRISTGIKLPYTLPITQVVAVMMQTSRGKISICPGLSASACVHMLEFVYATGAFLQAWRERVCFDTENRSHAYSGGISYCKSKR